jgi:HEAT repeat protein
MESRRTPFQNPYKPLQPAQGINFAGREDIIRTFRQRIAADARIGVPDNRHMLLVGVGGIGKTSLLLRLEHVFRQTYPRLRKRAIHLNLTDYSADAAGLIADLRAALPDPSHVRSGTLSFFGLGPTASRRDLVAKLKDDFEQSVALTFPIAGWQFTPGVFRKPLPPHEGIVKQLARLLAELSVLTSEDGRPTLVLIDDVGLATDIPGGPQLVHGLDRLMEATVREKNRNLLLVLADRPERKGQLEYHFRTELFHPAYVQMLNVYPLTQQEARSAVLNPAEEAGVHLSDRLASDLVESAGVHPYFLQIACSHVWDHLAAENKLGDQPVHLDTDTVAMIVTRGQAKLFEDFNSDEQYLLKVLARSGRPLDAIEIKRMVELEDKDDLVDVDSTLESLLKHKHRPITASRQRDDYGFTHALFRDYIREHKLTADERETTALQAALDAAAQLADLGIAVPEQAPLSPELLHSAWRHRHRHRIDDQLHRLLVLSDVFGDGPHDTWAVSPLAVSTLIPLLGTGAPDKQERVASALKRIGRPALEPLFVALQENNPSVRAAAMSILRRIGDTSTLHLILQGLSNDDPSVRAEAVDVLATVSDPRALDALIEALRDDDHSVRAEAARVLAEVSDPRAVDALIGSMCNDDGRESMQALGLLATASDPRALDAIIEVSRDEASLLRRHVLRVLANVSHPRALEALIDASRNRDPTTRMEAVRALGRVSGPPAFDAITRSLRDDDSSVRIQAVLALSDAADDRALEALADALGDRDPAVRFEAVLALSGVRDSRAVDALINALTWDDDERVRQAAADTLRRLPDASAVQRLVAWLTRHDGLRRDHALEALLAIGDKRAIPLLEQVAADSNYDPEVRHFAESAIERILQVQARTAAELGHTG